MLLGRVVTALDVFFEKHSCSVHFCLMNLMMISQTAQCWSTDGVFSSLSLEKDFWHQKNERLTVLSVIIVQFSMFFELY